MENINNLHWMAIGSATLVSFVFGNIWFHPGVFGTTWSESAGVEVSPTVGALVGTFVATLLVSIGVAFFLRAAGMSGITDGLLVGFFATLAFVLPAIIGQWLFMNKLPLFAVNIGFNLLNLLLIGAIIGAWQKG